MNRTHLACLALLSITLQAAGCATAADDGEPRDEAQSEGELRRATDASVAAQLDSRRAFLSGLPVEPGDASCSRKWSELTKDGVLDVVIARGYFDAELPGGHVFVGDESARRIVTKHLTAPCVPGYNACGFRVVEDSSATTTKSVLVKSATTREGRPLEVRVTMTNASYTMFDDDNRTIHRAAQERRTELAKGVFDEGLRSADVVFYAGHARDGGGPDFAPPRFVAGTTHVDYDWYQANRPGLKELVSRLSARDNAVRLLGLFACATKGHFESSLRRAAPGLGLIQSYKVTESEVLEVSMVGALDAAIGQKCAPSFQRSVDPDPRRKIELAGFF